jgi:disulfide bond formation protein DsbB
MERLTFPRAVLGGVAIASAGALGLAFLAQYGFDLWPCQMCYWQRVPYALTLGVGLLALMPGVDPTARRHSAFLCALLFAVNAGLGGFHAGVEYHWWQGPASCGAAARTFDLQDLAAALNKPGGAGCDEAAFRLFGVSMAGGNFIVDGLLAAGCLWAALQKRRWSAP